MLTGLGLLLIPFSAVTTKHGYGKETNL